MCTSMFLLKQQHFVTEMFCSFLNMLKFPTQCFLVNQLAIIFYRNLLDQQYAYMDRSFMFTKCFTVYCAYLFNLVCPAFLGDFKKFGTVFPRLSRHLTDDLGTVLNI